MDSYGGGHLEAEKTLREFDFRKAFYELNLLHKRLTIHKTFSKKFFFNAFNAIIKLFFTIVYIRIITLTLIFDDHPLMEYPL